jgi:SAM-dependent methyltransferase
METRVRDHYHEQNLIKNIDAGLKSAGKNTETLHIKDLALVDQLHTGGVQATLALVEKIAITPDFHILDAGCGLGGSSRLLAHTFGCRVSGMDLSPSFIETAQILTQRTGLFHKVKLQAGSILDMPWDNDTFFAVLCQHILMNIENKPAALKEIFRVLKPGGTLMLHEIVLGENTGLALPVPWADAADISFLASWETLAAWCLDIGFVLDEMTDATKAGCRYWQKVRAFAEKTVPGSRPLGPHLVFGENALSFPFTMSENFENNRIRLVEAFLKKP